MNAQIEKDLNNNKKNITVDKKEEIIKNIIDDIKPYLNADGGDIEFIKYEDNYVYVKLFGACSHCGYQDFTLNEGILNLIKEQVPEVKSVLNVEI